MGGQGTIEYFPMTLSLVINQTPDIQEQVFDLLQALRRLQDVEVAVEIRLISIAEGFYEYIGVNFNMNIKTDKNTQRFEPLITSGQFKPAGFINDFSPSRFLAGRDACRNVSFSPPTSTFRFRRRALAWRFRPLAASLTFPAATAVSSWAWRS